MKNPYPGLPSRPHSTSVYQSEAPSYDSLLMNALNPPSPALRHRRALLTRLRQHAYLRGRIEGRRSLRDDLFRQLENRRVQLEGEIRTVEKELYWNDPAYGSHFPNGFRLPHPPTELYEFLSQSLSAHEIPLLGHHARSQEEFVIKNGTYPRNYNFPLANYSPDQPRDDAGRWTDGGGRNAQEPEYYPPNVTGPTPWWAKPKQSVSTPVVPPPTVPKSPHYEINTVPPDTMKVTPKAPKLPKPVTPEQRARMAAEIFKYEARTDKNGKVIVYHPPKGDGGGKYEVAGITERDHPEMGAKLKALVESGRQDEAKKLAEDYFLRYTSAVTKYTSNPAIEFYLRDTSLNRGPTGAVKILQRALGVTPDGKVGEKTLAALHKAEENPEQLLDKLNEARVKYEDDVAGKRPQFRAGLISRWKQALHFAKTMIPENEHEK